MRERPEVETWFKELELPGRRVQVGDAVTICLYSDREAYEVVKVSPSGKTLELYPLKATLLNGFNSGEPDALVSHPGGFCHHVTGTQRYRYERYEEKDPRRVSKARWSEKRARYQTPRGTLIPGAHKHYDYNF